MAARLNPTPTTAISLPRGVPDRVAPRLRAREDEFAVVGTSFKLAALEARERLARPAARAALVGLAQAHAAMTHACLVVTCNRVECWGLADGPLPRACAPRIAGELSLDGGVIQALEGEPAFLHAVRVASGLDSAVWGEPQIAGQVQAASRISPDGSAAPRLQATIRRIFRGAQSVRKRAGLGPQSRGAPEASAELISRRLPGNRASVLIVGAGGVGRRAAACAGRFATVTVSDRNLEKARQVSLPLGGSALPLAEALARLRSFDGAIVAVSAPQPLISSAHLVPGASSRDRRVLLVDLSFPRAVAPEVKDLPGVQLLNVDDLAIEEAGLGAPASRRLAEQAAREEAAVLFHEQRAQRAEAVVAELRARAEAVRRDEVQRARRRLAGDPAADAATLDKFAERLVNRLLHDPTEGLRALWALEEPEAAERTARRIFGLEGRP